MTMSKADDNDKPKISLFKQVYSRHKRKGRDSNRIDDLLVNGSSVIDVHRILQSQEASAFGNDLVVALESLLQLPGLDSSTRKCLCFGFREFPGAYLYPRALNKDLQLELVHQAVTTYCELGPTEAAAEMEDNSNGEEEPAVSSSHRTNIDLLPPKPHERVNKPGNETETMWNLWKQEQTPISDRPPPGKKIKHNQNQHNPNNGNNYYRRFSKLSWATMGYHYDWTERSYHPQKKSSMPDLVARLSILFATSQPSRETEQNGTVSPSTLKFTPSASIVNYYTTKSTMGGHRDDLEDPDAMDKPIVSMSLGLPGIFVLGGPTKDEESCNERNSVTPHPVRAIVLRPGDVLIMGGDSRLNYHAMSRVLPYEAALEYEKRTGCRDSCMDDALPSFANLSPKDLSLERHDNTAENDDFAYLTEYLRHHRVNINVRQVYPDK